MAKVTGSDLDIDLDGKISERVNVEWGNACRLRAISFKIKYE